MGKIEKYQKELDLLLEKLRFWRYVIFGIVSGTLGIIISASQDKLRFNVTIMLVLMIAFIAIIISIKRLESLTEEYKVLLELLEKEEE